MHVDRQTLKDLEILRSRDGGPSVAHLLDLTHTRAGRRKLRERLTSPMSDPVLIGDNLDAVRFLAGGAFELGLDTRLMADLEAYLDSNLASLGDRGMRAGRLEAAWIGLRTPELLDAARVGVDLTRRLVARLRSVTAALDRAGPPREIRRLLDNVTGLLNKLHLERLWPDDRAWTVLGADSVLRGAVRGDLMRLLELLGELDAYAAAGRLLDQGFTLPEPAREPGAPLVEGEGIRHPFLPHGVPNPVGLRGGETLVFLTGPNMAGKTTYLRAVAVCTYLAHCGLPVPAVRFRFAPLDALFTSLSPEDNLRDGTSLFLAEVKRVRQVLEAVAAGGRTLAVFDEVFRGTNVSDALDATRQVILGCARAGRSAFIFSSHLAELARELEAVPSVRLFHFRGEVRQGEATFDHTLRPGASAQRLGLQLLREEGVDRLLEALGASASDAGER